MNDPVTFVSVPTLNVKLTWCSIPFSTKLKQFNVLNSSITDAKKKKMWCFNRFFASHHWTLHDSYPFGHYITFVYCSSIYHVPFKKFLINSLPTNITMHSINNFSTFCTACSQSTPKHDYSTSLIIYTFLNFERCFDPFHFSSNPIPLIK